MYHNIRILAETHSVRVISFIENEAERERLRSLEGVCESVVAVQRIPDFRPHWLSLAPFLVREFSTPQMYEAVDAAIRNKRVDVLQCEYLQMAQFRRADIFSVLTIHETLSNRCRQQSHLRVDPDPPGAAHRRRPSRATGMPAQSSSSEG